MCVCGGGGGGSHSTSPEVAANWVVCASSVETKGLGLSRFSGRLCFTKH